MVVGGSIRFGLRNTCVQAMICTKHVRGMERSACKKPGTSSWPASFVGRPSVAMTTSSLRSVSAAAFSASTCRNTRASGVKPCGGAKLKAACSCAAPVAAFIGGRFRK